MNSIFPWPEKQLYIVIYFLIKDQIFVRICLSEARLYMPTTPLCRRQFANNSLADTLIDIHTRQKVKHHVSINVV